MSDEEAPIAPQETPGSAKLTPGELFATHQAYEVRVAAGRKCGADYLISEMTKVIGRTYTRALMQDLIKKFATGATPEQIRDSYGAGRGRKTKATPVLVTKIETDIAAKRDNAANSQRGLAKRRNTSKYTVGQALKNGKYTVQKRTTLPRTSGETKETRVTGRRKFPEMRDAGEFLSEESYF